MNADQDSLQAAQIRQANIDVHRREAQIYDLVHPGDAAALAERLLYALHNLEEAQLLGRAARQAAEGFSIDAMITAYDTLYRETISR